MAIIKNYRLRLDAGNITPLIIHVNQYDKNEIWNFTLIDYQGNQYITTEAAIVGKKPDGCLIVNNCTVSEGIVSVEVTEQMTAAAGKAVFELLVDGQLHGTANFIVMIERSPQDGAIESESDLSLFQQAIDATSTPAIIAGVQAWMDENLTPTTPVVDSSLSITGAAADAKKTGDEISDLKSEIQQGGLSSIAKNALLNCFANVAWINGNGQSLYNALASALDSTATVTSITAEYVQSDIVYDTDPLDSLKSDLTVTAHYSDGTSLAISDYVLSGFSNGTVTVGYSGFTTTFNVDVISVKTTNGLQIGLKSGTTVNEIVASTNNARACAFATSGQYPVQYASGGDTQYYPFPIREGTTTITIANRPSALNAAIGLLKYEDGKWCRKTATASAATDTINVSDWNDGTWYGYMSITPLNNQDISGYDVESMTYTFS